MPLFLVMDTELRRIMVHCVVAKVGAVVPPHQARQAFHSTPIDVPEVTQS